MARNEAEVEQRNQQCLEAFVVRARRVAEHSLAGDWEKLVALVNPKAEVRCENGEWWLLYELPAEEVVESAAARIRPIILKTEDCFHMKVLNALGYACRELPRDAERVQAVRAEWKIRVDPATPLDAAYRVLVADAVTGEEHDLDAHRLAMAWIYGDVVHHDTERRKESDPFGLRDRFRAAVPLVAWTMVATIELLNYIEALWKDGVLQLRPEVFDVQVAMKSTVWEEPVQMAIAPVGTELPSSATTAMPEGWLPVDKNTDLSRLQSILGGQLLHSTSTAPATAAPSEHADEGRLEDAGATPLTAPPAPRQPTKDWQAVLIERWRMMQP
ncbi:hypothetical protein [Streptomyces sp. NRRL F-2747]|uniref:hypothetical protein n=1 Tax=Streptomyces sp. NRRL F-2747 TaxID=1463843 RepID=UPI0018FEF333|nr:hypothetical protein [Streptomyces sp. NRRL F-2747]